MYNIIMTAQSVRQLRSALACLLIGIAICVIIKPHGLVANSGVSYYGTFRATILPYSLALLGSAWFFSRSAHFMPAATPICLRSSMYVFSILLAGIFLTPYSLNSIFDWTHTILGTILFASQLIITGVLAYELRSNHSFLYLWAAELLAGIICAIYVLPPKGYLIEFQVVFQIIFIALLIHYLNFLKYNEARTNESNLNKSKNFLK
jgi:hypothetical protein